MTDDTYDFEKHITLGEYEDFVSEFMLPLISEKDILATASIGLGGEFADLANKVHGGLKFDDDVRSKFIKELGNIMFYVAFAARNVCGVNVQDIMDENVVELNRGPAI